ncbi:hypothetical protein HNP84_009515 [Thermocatellispora tengchongensis]|uniref:Uncharacterized protein n=1 Tax=Thermocatellispora tengchongensis TaxID=1073253 RepID=A0A840PPQ2_9ACTN|nr:hypothetical protein [Thermocatellispora tengchongensis]MBB5139751.1 hypothetical protein [Thermocatellispora tengchongensis]
MVRSEFPAVTADAVRILGSNSGDYSRIIEVEVFSCPAGPGGRWGPPGP